MSAIYCAIAPVAIFHCSLTRLIGSTWRRFTRAGYRVEMQEPEKGYNRHRAKARTCSRVGFYSRFLTRVRRALDAVSPAMDWRCRSHHLAQSSRSMATVICI